MKALDGVGGADILNKTSKVFGGDRKKARASLVNQTRKVARKDAIKAIKQRQSATSPPPELPEPEECPMPEEPEEPEEPEVQKCPIPHPEEPVEKNPIPAEETETEVLPPSSQPRQMKKRFSVMVARVGFLPFPVVLSSPNPTLCSTG